VSTLVDHSRYGLPSLSSQKDIPMTTPKYDSKSAAKPQTAVMDNSEVTLRPHTNHSELERILIKLVARIFLEAFCF